MYSQSQVTSSTQSKVTSPTESIRDAKVLQGLMIRADEAIAGRNADFFTSKKGEFRRPIEWGKLEESLQLMVRADATKIRDSYALGGAGEQVDHIFEVQYFSAVFLHTVAETILSGEVYSPETEDIFFAINLVNHGQNLMALKTEFHTPKSTYFRAGNTKPIFSQKLLDYLVAAAPKLNKAFNDVLLTVKQSEHHQSFKTKFINNLLNTPWCAGDRWEAILRGDKPFSTNLTVTNYYVSPKFVDDNVDHKS